MFTMFLSCLFVDFIAFKYRNVITGISLSTHYPLGCDLFSLANHIKVEKPDCTFSLSANLASDKTDKSVLATSVHIVRKPPKAQLSTKNQTIQISPILSQTSTVVTIDLADEKLLHNKTKLNKMKDRLKNLEEKFNVLISWHPPNEDICPSSIAKYFVDLGYKVVSCTPAFRRSVVNCQIPELDLAAIEKNGAAEFAEWLGMLSLGGVLHTQPGDYLSSYVPPSVGEKKGPVTCLQWRGFFAATDVSGLIQQIANSCDPSDESWISVYVQGFDDCPVAWGSEEHHCFTNGDNAYLIIFNKSRGLICTQKCSRKKYK